MDIQAQAIAFQQAYDQLIELVTPIETSETLPRLEAVGRVLAKEVFSEINVPSFAMSAMDGVAVRFEANAACQIVQTTFAGDDQDDQTPCLSAQHAIKITTGAAVPQGIDCVIPIEDVQWIDKDKRLILPATKPNKTHIKAIGSDISQGKKLLSNGHRITDKDLALLASVGVQSVTVVRKPKVLIVLSGNELKLPGASSDLPPGKIHEANADWLKHKLNGLSCELVDCLWVEDNETKMMACIERYQDQVDLIISVGGASVGEKDFIRPLMLDFQEREHQVGRGQFCERHFWKLTMKPAKPFSVLKTKNLVWLALPGNPLACFMSFQLFVVSVIQTLQSQADSSPLSSYLPLSESLNNPTDKLVWQLVRLDKKGEELDPVVPSSSSHLISLSQADGYIAIQPNSALKVGHKTAFWRFV